MENVYPCVNQASHVMSPRNPPTHPVNAGGVIFLVIDCRRRMLDTAGVYDVVSPSTRDSIPPRSWSSIRPVLRIEYPQGRCSLTRRTITREPASLHLVRYSYFLTPHSHRIPAGIPADTPAFLPQACSSTINHLTTGIFSPHIHG
jgi:hypothetical protein